MNTDKYISIINSASNSHTHLVLKSNSINQLTPKIKLPFIIVYKITEWRN